MTLGQVRNSCLLVINNGKLGVPAHIVYRLRRNMTKAEEYVISCVRQALAADKQEMVPVLGIKMYSQENSDSPEDAVVVSYDEVQHSFHLYIMCSKAHKNIIVEMFGLSKHDFVGDVGHVYFDTPEISNLYLPLVENFEENLKRAVEDYMRLYQSWVNALKKESC